MLLWTVHKRIGSFVDHLNFLASIKVHHGVHVCHFKELLVSNNNSIVIEWHEHNYNSSLTSRLGVANS